MNQRLQSCVALMMLIEYTQRQLHKMLLMCCSHVLMGIRVCRTGPYITHTPHCSLRIRPVVIISVNCFRSALRVVSPSHCFNTHAHTKRICEARRSLFVSHNSNNSSNNIMKVCCPPIRVDGNVSLTRLSVS